MRQGSGVMRLPRSGQLFTRISHYALPLMASSRNGFVNPEYLILIALTGIGVALVSPVLWSLMQSEPVSTWDWVGLGTGALMIGGCVAWFVKWNN